MESQKRKRSANWSETEKALLKQLIMEKIEIIENKDVSTNTNQLKKKAWQEVLSSFNNMNNQPRDLPQLVAQWRNTKSVVKKHEFAYRRARNATGGGPPPPSPPSEDRALIELMPNEFEVDSNMFDSDGQHISKVSVHEVIVDQNSNTLHIAEEMPSTSYSDPAATANIVSTSITPYTTLVSVSPQIGKGVTKKKYVGFATQQAEDG